MEGCAEVPPFFQHVAEWQVPELRFNPASDWTYGDENLVGSLVEVVESTHPKTIAVVALTKWLILDLG